MDRLGKFAARGQEAIGHVQAAVAAAERNTLLDDEMARDYLALAGLALESLRRLIDAPVPAVVHAVPRNGSTIPEVA